jgi:two-component system, OmpR family, response regulator
MSRVLLVEDERRLANFVARALESDGHGVDVCVDGEAGLAQALTGCYQLVVLDLLLPRLDGESVLRNLVMARPEQQVLVLSALSEVAERVRCLQLGAADFLGKPFALDELVARVAARMRGANSAASIGGTVRLNVVARTVDVGDGPLPLSGREYRVLDYLLRHRDHVCTREQILADVWGYWFDPGSNVVDVVVRRLRQKLGGDLIETVRHVGYRIATA